ncbi:hypothetical protein GW17_00028806 [Ensete ventricosum]|nr:hypothetical protein GW17_00028806 [Ensete ventricosum]
MYLTATSSPVFLSFTSLATPKFPAPSSFSSSYLSSIRPPNTDSTPNETGAALGLLRRNPPEESIDHPHPGRFLRGHVSITGVRSARATPQQGRGLRKDVVGGVGMESGRHPLKCKVAFRKAICAPQRTTEHGNGSTWSDLSASCSCGSRARPRIYTPGEIKKHERYNLSSLPTRNSILREAYCISL